MSINVSVTWWDRVLLSVFPGWGMRRLKARASAAYFDSHFEATSGGRRTDNWRRRGTDANAANLSALPELRNIARDLRRNNGWARRGIEVIANNTIGWGIKPSAGAAGKRTLKAATDAWHGWAGSTACHFDGLLDFYGIQRLVMTTVVESGECLVVRERASATDGLSIPIRLNVVEPDLLDGNQDAQQLKDGAHILGGIEHDGRGRRLAYWILDAHPGDATRASAKSRRIPAEDVIHVFRVERPKQVRGTPWLCAAIAPLHGLDEYEDAVLMQSKIAACFGAFVHDVDGMGARLGDSQDGDDRIEDLEPGQIQYLRPGESVSFGSPPPAPSTNLPTATLRKIAASLGVTYEDLTNDYSNVNFSSARMARLSHQANVYHWQWHMMIPQLCAGVWRWAMGEAARLEGWRELPAASWAAPPIPMLDPDKEGLAYQRLIRSGVRALPDVLDELGEDFAEHVLKIAAANKLLDDNGVVLDSDPRRTTSNGQAQGAEKPGPSSDAPAAG